MVEISLRVPLRNAKKTVSSLHTEIHNGWRIEIKITQSETCVFFLLDILLTDFEQYCTVKMSQENYFAHVPVFSLNQRFARIRLYFTCITSPDYCMPHSFQ